MFFKFCYVEFELVAVFIKILARVGGNLNNDFQKCQMPRGLPGGGGELKLQFDRYVSFLVILNKKEIELQS